MESQSGKSTPDAADAEAQRREPAYGRDAERFNAEQAFGRRVVEIIMAHDDLTTPRSDAWYSAQYEWILTAARARNLLDQEAGL